MNKTLTYVFQKSTKNTHVYQNAEHNVSYYLPKDLFQGPAPKEITVTVSVPVPATV